MRIFNFLLVILLVSSCGVTVNYDYESSTDFSNYKSYSYYSDLETGLSELDTKRLLRILDVSMQAKGFTKSDYADFMINISSSEYQNPNRNTVSVGAGGTGRNVGGGLSVGIPIGQSKFNREIVFEFVDANSNRLFWQAVSESSFNPNATPEKREMSLKDVVDKVLEGYPPEKK
jgi:hypothetical protein